MAKDISYNPEKDNEQLEIAAEVTKNLIGFIVGDSKKLSKLERSYQVAGKKAVIAHPRFKVSLESLNRVVKKLLFNLNADTTTFAETIFKTHNHNDIEPWMLLEGFYFIEDYIKDHHPTLLEVSLKNIRSLTLNIVKLYHKDGQETHITQIKKQENELKKAMSSFGNVLGQAARGNLDVMVDTKAIALKHEPIRNDINIMIGSIKKAQSKLQEVLEAQRQTIKELQTPVIPVWKSIFMAPFVGSFDSARIQELHEGILEAVAKEKPKKIIMDLSGLSHVDTHIIGELVKLISSLRLLGTKAILVGIKPYVAQQLIRIGANLEGIPTYATLEQGLRSAIHK